MSIDVQEGRDLHKAAIRDWEFHDASAPFCHFMTWIEDNFVDLTDLALQAQALYPAPLPKTCKEAGDRCRHICTINLRTGDIVDPECFR